MRRLTLTLAVVLVVWVLATGLTSASAQGPTAESALLRVTDLPAGWMETPAAFVPSEGAVTDQCGGGPPVLPASFATVSFQRGEEGPYVMHAVAVFTPTSAEIALRYIRAEYTHCDGTRPGPPLDPIELPGGLGDEALAVRSTEAFGGVATVDVVVVRVGSAISLIQVVQFGVAGPTDPTLAERMTRIAVARLAQLMSAKSK